MQLTLYILPRLIFWNAIKLIINKPGGYNWILMHIILFSGCSVTILIAVLVELTSVEKLPKALGIYQLISTIGWGSGAPLAGKIIDILRIKDAYVGTVRGLPNHRRQSVVYIHLMLVNVLFYWHKSSHQAVFGIY